MFRGRSQCSLLIKGIVLSVIASLLGCYWAHIMSWILQQKFVLGPHTYLFPIWQHTPMPVYFKVHFWNWTNPHEVGIDGFKPKFTEIGPYTFIESHDKVNITWHVNGTVSFRRLKRFWFQADLSNGTLDDNVTSINALAVSASHVTKSWSSWYQYILEAGLRTTGQNIYWTHNISELMFEGFQNNLLNVANNLNTGLPKQDRFAWFYKENNTIEPHLLSMDTGQFNSSRFGHFTGWDNKSTMGHYRGQCDEVRGLYGEYLPTNIADNNKLEIFSIEMCRTVAYYKTGESYYKQIPVYEYTNTPMTLDNGTLRTDNNCYNTGTTALPSGVYNRTSCSFGAPLFMSFPHFYLADQSYRDAVKGMHPNKIKHESIMRINPNTGQQTNTSQRYQLNILVENNPKLTMFTAVNTTYFPILWIEVSAMLPEYYYIHTFLYHVALVTGSPSLFAFASLVIILTLIILYRRAKQAKKTKIKNLLQQTQSIVKNEFAMPLIKTVR